MNCKIRKSKILETSIIQTRLLFHTHFHFLSVHFKSVETCLFPECLAGDTRFIWKKCSEPFDYVCGNMSKSAIINLF